MAYANTNGLKKDNSINNDLKEIKLVIKAYLAQNLFEDKYFYQIYFKIDDDLNKALPYFKSIN